MPEILTESFCERCGTRYTFQAAAPNRSRLSRLRVVVRGLRNYVLSDDTTLEEAFADARSDEEREISAQQLEAFHRTFNFCLSCRQYTCANCWNEPEGRCLSCAPDLSREPLPAPFPTLSTTVEALRPVAGFDRDGAEAAERAEPVAVDRAPSPAVEAAPPPAPPIERAAAAEQTSALLGRFRPVQPEVAEPPPLAEPAAAAVQPPPLLPSAAIPPELAAELGPEVAPGPPAEVSPVPETVAAAETSPAPAAPEIVPAEPSPAAPIMPTTPVDRSPQPVWSPPVAPRPPSLPPAAPAPTPTPTPPPPAWPPVQLGSRPAGHALGADAVWAESSRDLLRPRTGGVQACVACGLPVSATARFCRRCGTPQHRD